MTPRAGIRLFVIVFNGMACLHIWRRSHTCWGAGVDQPLLSSGDGGCAGTESIYGGVQDAYAHTREAARVLQGQATSQNSFESILVTTVVYVVVSSLAILSIELITASMAYSKLAPPLPLSSYKASHPACA